MNIKVKKVYYCDYCKKHSLRTIKKHEKHCTMNPDRECRLCGRKETLNDLINKYKLTMSFTEVDKPFGKEMQDIKQPTIKEIQENFDMEYGYCPICTLSVIRQLGLNKYPYNISSVFDMKKELDGWWAEVNSEQEQYY